MNRYAQLATLCLSLMIPGLAAGQAVPPGMVPPSPWQRVNGLRPGTRVAVTLNTDDKRIGRFRRSTIDDVTIEVGHDGDRVTEVTLPKAQVRRVSLHDPASDGSSWGALIGVGGAVALFQASVSGCGRGCENDLPAGMPLLVGAVGTGVGTAVGFLVDRLGNHSDVLFPPSEATVRSAPAGANRFFPARPALRVGPVYSQTSFRSAQVEGSAGGVGLAIAGQIAPYLSLHAEYSGFDGWFHRTPGIVPQSVLDNVVPEAARVAGRSQGIESRHLSFVFSELVGVHPPPWGRVRVEGLVGVSVRGQEDRDYYEAWRAFGQGTMNDPSRVERIPGKYYVLSFESPEAGLIYGLEAEVAVARRLVVVPTFRYSPGQNPGPSTTYGVGVHWRF